MEGGHGDRSREERESGEREWGGGGGGEVERRARAGGRRATTPPPKRTMKRDEGGRDDDPHEEEEEEEFYDAIGDPDFPAAAVAPRRQEEEEEEASRRPSPPSDLEGGGGGGWCSPRPRGAEAGGAGGGGVERRPKVPDDGPRPRAPSSPPRRSSLPTSSSSSSSSREERGPSSIDASLLPPAAEAEEGSRGFGSNPPPPASAPLLPSPSTTTTSPKTTRTERSFRITNRDTGETHDLRNLSLTSGVVGHSKTDLIPSRASLTRTLSANNSRKKKKEKGGGSVDDGSSDDDGGSSSGGGSWGIGWLKESASGPQTQAQTTTDSGGGGNGNGNGATKAGSILADMDGTTTAKDSGGKGDGGHFRMSSKLKKGKSAVGGLARSVAKGVKKSARNVASSSTSSAASSSVPTTPHVKHLRFSNKAASAVAMPRNTIPIRSSRKRRRPPSSSSSAAAATEPHPLGGGGTDAMLLVDTKRKAHAGPIWCLSFDKTGSCLASGGEDGVVCVWEVAPAVVAAGSAGERREERRGDDGDGKERADDDEEGRPTTVGHGPEFGTEVKILSSEPLRRYADHAADVIDFSWSPTNFLLSASLDRSVRLYHPSKEGCLKVFIHADLVTSVDFHPADDRFFLSGSFDRRIRVWSIPDGRVKGWARTPEYVTAARYDPSGRFAVAGLFTGRVYFYDADDGLKYYTQIEARNRRGKEKDGRKVTGLEFRREARGGKGREGAGGRGSRPSSPATATAAVDGASDAAEAAPSAEETEIRRTTTTSPPASPPRPRFSDRMLVTTNDSRIRLYGLDDYCMIRKYKGLSNGSMQIGARLSESGDRVVCGSETGTVHVWDARPSENDGGGGSRGSGSVSPPRRRSTAAAGTASATAAERELLVGGMRGYDRTKPRESFEATRCSIPVVTDATFVPARSMGRALIESGLFPSLGDSLLPTTTTNGGGADGGGIRWDMSSAAIVTSDYEGTVRVFLRRSFLDKVFYAAGPGGWTDEV